MPLVIYDTLRREKVDFDPREPGKAAIYVCGPTVYGAAHVGHARMAVVFDVLVRYLRHRGADVTVVMNITDMDDKIISRANEEGVSAFEIADRYTRAWNGDMDALGVLPPDMQPHATAHILEMQELIADLIEKGNAYESEGNVLFRVRTFDGYGKLSGRRLEDAAQPADVPAVAKEDPIDFALWKAAKPGEPSWPSPWGPGRPGWHIECSAMAAKHLGHGFDLHGGGLDLIFPHHENEIAQHEAAHGPEFARFWMHNGMVELAETKMSKSIGNVVSIQEALARWGRGPMRLWYASASYRSPLQFSEALLDEHVAAFDRLVTFVRNGRRFDADPDADVVAQQTAAFEETLDDDLNLAGALAVLYDAVADGNEALPDAERRDEDAAARVAALAEVVASLGDGVLGLGISDELAPAERLADRVAPLVEDLLSRRAAAREERDFATADALRDALSAAGIVVEDRPDGARWYAAVHRGRDGDQQEQPRSDGATGLPTAEA
ncbi:MAG: cysteine--tRNA ligase [Nitriliruptorales bacterium]